MVSLKAEILKGVIVQVNPVDLKVPINNDVASFVNHFV